MAARRRRKRSRNLTQRPTETEPLVMPLEPAVESAFDALDELYAPSQTIHETESQLDGHSQSRQLAAVHEQVLEDYFASFQSRRASNRTLEGCRLYLKYLTEKNFPNLVFFSAV